MSKVILKKIEPGEAIKNILSQYYSVGGVIDFAFFEYPTGQDQYACHESAARDGVDLFLDSPQIKSEESIEPLGTWISWSKFLGSTLDPENPFYLKRSEQSDESRNGVSTEAFVDAFRLPPYSIGIKADELYQLLCDVLREVLNNGENVQIMQWSTDWSPYFDPGLEWWGAFCWTVQIGHDRIVVVGASTTD